jgi:hypothetical protein
MKKLSPAFRVDRAYPRRRRSLLDITRIAS